MTYFSSLLNEVIEIMSKLTQEDIEKYGNEYSNICFEKNL